MELRVDGLVVSVPEGATVLEACDLAGRYVPRLCSYPGLRCLCECGETAAACGLCAVQVGRGGEGGSNGAVMVLACGTAAQPGMDVVTDDPASRSQRLERLAGLLARHPHVCLSCPDRDGCAREDCTFGIAAGARCCDEFGRCEFGRLVAYVDADEELPRRAVAVSRATSTEGRLRREQGLCLGCGRCVAVCSTSPAAGRALRLARAEGAMSARPGEEIPPVAASGRPLAAAKKDGLRASGCTFCGQCVMVCPTGALTAPGEAGTRWLEGWRKRTGLLPPVLPPDPWRPLTEGELATVPTGPGVLFLADVFGRILRIGGVPDLSRGIALAMAEPACASACLFRIEPAPLFTQRESELLAHFAQEYGHLPPGNDIDDDLFSDNLFSDDFE